MFEFEGRRTRGVQNKRRRIRIARSAGVSIRRGLVGDIYVRELWHVVCGNREPVFDSGLCKRDNSRFLTDEKMFRVCGGQ